MASFHFRRLPFLFYMVIFACALLQGCPIPHFEGYNQSRENLTTESTLLLQEGITTREDVLLMLGEPDVSKYDDRWLIYDSEYGHGGIQILICGAGPGGAGCLIPGAERITQIKLMLGFNEDGILIDINRMEGSCWSLTGLFDDDDECLRTTIDAGE